jgi:hypothetical protein
MPPPKTNEPDEARRRKGDFRRKAEPATFRVAPHRFGFHAGVDLDKLNQLVDELEAEEASSSRRDV